MRILIHRKINKLLHNKILFVNATSCYREDNWISWTEEKLFKQENNLVQHIKFCKTPISRIFRSTYVYYLYGTWNSSLEHFWHAWKARYTIINSSAPKNCNKRKFYYCLWKRFRISSVQLSKIESKNNKFQHVFIIRKWICLWQSVQIQWT